MNGDFHREYQLRLPLPMAQLYRRAHDAKEARSLHENIYYLFEATIKLAVAPAIACYLSEIDEGSARVAALDRVLARLALPSFGHWVEMLRELSRYFGTRTDASSHPLGHVWRELNEPRRTAAGLLALYCRIKNGPDGKPVDSGHCTLLQVFEALVQYRNGVQGHGGPRFDSFYDKEMGPLLFPAANDFLSDGFFSVLGPRGSRLVYLTEPRLIDEDQVEVSIRELIGLHGERSAPLTIGRAQAGGLAGSRVAVLWPGRPVPLPLDPLLLYREGELADELLYLNRDRIGRQVEYLSYTTGRVERDRSMAPAVAALLSRITGRTVSEGQFAALAAQSLAETSSVESILGPPPTAGRVLGDFEVIAEIGRGGMGVVYLARQLSLGRLVALKMLPADLAGDELSLARFRREMRLLARCDHPHIVKVLDNGTMPDGRVYYAMEYVPGCNLEQVWRELTGSSGAGESSTLSGSEWARAVLSASRKQRDQAIPPERPVTDAPAPSPSVPTLPLPPLPERPSMPEDPGGYIRRVVMLVRDAALALQTVHDQDVIHRDVKPANLMLTPDGTRVVLMDFGLAKGKSLELTSSHAGGLLGTLRYAAPEQLAAATLKIGPTADVRGLGVTLWELLTRRRLFADADDEKQLAARIFETDVPRLRSIDPGLDPDLEAIVARATERRTPDRIATAARLAEYLQLYLDGKPLPIRTPTSRELVVRWVRRHPAVAGLLGALAASLIGGFSAVTWEWRQARYHQRLAEQQKGIAVQQKAAAEEQKGIAERQKLVAEANFNRARQAVDNFFNKVSEDKLLNVPGLQPLRKELLEDALQYYQDFVKQRADDPELRSAMAAAYFRVARISEAIGNEDAVVDAYRKSIELREALVRERSDVDDYQSDLAWTYNNLAAVLSNSSRAAEAEPLHRKALAIREGLTRKHVDDNLSKKYRYDLSFSYYNIGDIEAARGRLEAAEASHLKALEIREGLVRADPKDADYREALAWSHVTLAMVLDSGGNKTPVIDHLKQSLSLREALVKDFPAAIEYRGALAGAYGALGLQYQLTSQTNAALAEYRKAVPLLEKLAAANPSVVDYQLKLAAGHNAIGYSDLMLGQTTQAIEEFRLSLPIYEKLAREHPKNHTYRQSVVVGRQSLAIAYLILGRFDDCEASWKESLAILDQLSREDPTSVGFRAARVTILNARALTFQRAGLKEQALKGYQESLAAARQLARDHPGVRDYQDSIATACGGLAKAYQENGQPDQAVACYREAMDINEKLAREEPNAFSHKSGLIDCMVGMSELYYGQGDVPKAIEWNQKAVALLESMTDAFPGPGFVGQSLGAAYRSAAGFLIVMGRSEEAVRLLRKARPFLEKLASDPSASAELREALAFCLASLGTYDEAAGKTSEAEAAFRKAVPIYEGLLGPQPDDPKFLLGASQCLCSLAILSQSKGRADRAGDELTKATTYFTKIKSEDVFDPIVLLSIPTFGLTLGLKNQEFGRATEALAVFDNALSVTAAIGRMIPLDAQTKSVVAEVHRCRSISLQSSGKPDQAESECRQAIASLERLVQAAPGDENLNSLLATSQATLAEILRLRGRNADAEAVCRKAVGILEKLAAGHPGNPRYRQLRASAYDTLGLIDQAGGRLDRARKDFEMEVAVCEAWLRDDAASRTARAQRSQGLANLKQVLTASRLWDDALALNRKWLAIYRKECADHPGDPAFQAELSQELWATGGIQEAAGRLDEADAASKEAIHVQEALARAHPQDQVVVTNLAAMYAWYASLAYRRQRWQSTTEWATKSIQAIESLPKMSPQPEEVRRNLVQAYSVRAVARTYLKDHRGALGDWERAIQYDDGRDRDSLKANHAGILVRLGELDRGIAEVDGLGTAETQPGSLAYSKACVYSLASAAVVEDRKLAPTEKRQRSEQFALRAIDQLSSAYKLGFFKDPAEFDNVTRDIDLDPLRTRPDFQRLLAEIRESKGGPR